jgi:hypothetical protein
MEIFQVGMAKSIINCYSVLGIENQHLFEEIQGLLVHVGEKTIEGSLFDKGNLVQALLSHN